MARKIVKSIKDGLSSLSNTLINSRSSVSTNCFTPIALSPEELRAIYSTGIGQKIVSIKASGAMADSLVFEKEGSEDFYSKSLSKLVLESVKYMIGFGRGTIVVFSPDDDLSKPLKPKDKTKLRAQVFGGDEVTVSQTPLDLMHDRFNKPLFYSIRGSLIHYSRVVDFTYVRPANYDLPYYRYGGIPEFELIYPQLVNDGIIERGIGAVIDKNASMFYKVDGFKEAMRAQRDGDIVSYFQTVESMRSLMSATILDKEDEAQVLSQSLTNLADVDKISLRRLALVTGVPLPYLVGEAVQGLNSTGSNERAIFGEMIIGLQQQYILEPLQQLFDLYDLGAVSFINDQGVTAQEQIANEAAAIDNALKLQSMGEDHAQYLVEKGVIRQEDIEEDEEGEEDEDD